MSLCMGCMQEKGDVDICPHCGYAAEAEAENAAYLPPGTVLQGRYLLGKVLGQGGFGITYIGYDQTLHTRVAIKEYYPGDIAQRTPGDRTVMPYTQAENDYEHGRERFLEEARTLARFSEFPGIVSVKDCFADGNTAYMVMQFLEGINLKEYLNRKGGKVSPEEAVSILTPVMDALKEVHRAGIIHRDISPDNIFITSEGQVKLIDFGAARQSLGGGKSLSVQLKPGYAPEEQYRTHGNQGTWTDVYALAATLYRMVTGQVPPEAMERLSYDTLEIPAGLPENIRIALQMGLAVRAPERYATIEQFQNVLNGTSAVADRNAHIPEHSAGHMVYPAQTAAKPNGINKILILIVAACACIIVAAAVFIGVLLTSSDTEPVNTVPEAVPAASVAEPTPQPTPAVVQLPNLYNPSLSYRRMEGIASAQVVTSKDVYDGVCEAIRGFSDAYSQFVAADMGAGSMERYQSYMSQYAEVNSKAYTTQWEYYNKWNIDYYRLQNSVVSSVSSNGNTLFAWAYEQIEERKNGVVTTTSENWIYRLEWDGYRYLITDYISDPDKK